MRVLSPRDGGKIQLLRAGKTEARLAIRADEHNAEFRQYFAFVARDLGGSRCTFEIVNAGDCTYGDAFEDYRVCASTDGEDWFRAPTEFDGATLRFECDGQDAVSFAYYPPYGRARRRTLVERARSSGRIAVQDLGKSLRGETMQLLSLGRRDEDAPKLWIVAQQHPGETMAGWFMEGLVGRLVMSDDDDEAVSRLLGEAGLFLVLCMNPDGAFAGNHRTNAAGNDLNRCWWEADAKESPEVLCVREAMYEHGVDFFLDVHGDEHVPYVFVAGAEGNPHYTDRIESLEDVFSEAMFEATTDFQTEHGYPKDAPGKGDLRCAGNYVGEAFDCLSLTLEMPFKDNDDDPDERAGWSLDRCRALGSASLEAAAGMIDRLR